MEHGDLSIEKWPSDQLGGGRSLKTTKMMMNSECGGEPPLKKRTESKVSVLWNGVSLLGGRGHFTDHFRLEFQTARWIGKTTNTHDAEEKSENGENLREWVDSGEYARDYVAIFLEAYRIFAEETMRSA